MDRVLEPIFHPLARYVSGSATTVDGAVGHDVEELGEHHGNGGLWSGGEAVFPRATYLAGTGC